MSGGHIKGSYFNKYGHLCFITDTQVFTFPPYLLGCQVELISYTSSPAFGANDVGNLPAMFKNIKNIYSYCGDLSRVTRNIYNHLGYKMFSPLKD